MSQENESVPMDVDIHIFNFNNRELIISLKNDIGLNIDKIMHISKMVSEAKQKNSHKLNTKKIDEILSESEASLFYDTYYCHYIEEDVSYNLSPETINQF